MYQFFFKRRQMAVILIGFAIIAGNPVASSLLQSSETLEEVAADDPNSSDEFYPDVYPRNYPIHLENWIPTQSFKRPARSSLADRIRRSYCTTVSYHSDSQIGHQATCPFDWVVNYENRRIPKKIIEQVCRSCRSCGPNRFCAQLKVRTEVFFRDTAEFSQLEVRAGCVCIPHEIGSTSNPFELIV